MKPRIVIIDTDPGIDDAAAIAVMLSEPSVDVRLIASVSGNVGIEHTTNNALKLLTFLKKDVPVAKGAAAPLLRDIALLIQTFPEVKEKIEEIIMMGGSTERGNIGIYGEFNVTIDPEAAKIVFRSGIPITMVGLDIGRKARLTAEDLEELEKSGEAGTMISSLFRSYDGGHVEEGVKMYDPSAAMYLMEPELFETKEAFVDVEISSPLTIGATVVDYDGTLSETKNAAVCVDVDVECFRRRYVERAANIKC